MEDNVTKDIEEINEDLDGASKDIDICRTLYNSTRTFMLSR